MFNGNDKDDAAFIAFIENTDSQDVNVAFLRSTVEIYPEETLKKIERYLAVYREIAEQFKKVPPHLEEDFRQYKTDLDELKQTANDVIARKARGSQKSKQQYDLSKVHSGMPLPGTPVGTESDPDETPLLR